MEYMYLCTKSKMEFFLAVIKMCQKSKRVHIYRKLDVPLPLYRQLVLMVIYIGS